MAKETKSSRVCLRCDKSFLSLGSGNRICNKCAAINKTAQVKRRHMVFIHAKDVERS